MAHRSVLQSLVGDFSEMFGKGLEKELPNFSSWFGNACQYDCLIVGC